RAEEWILGGRLGTHRVQFERANLAHVDLDAYLHPLREASAGHGTGGDAHHGLARRGTAATEMVAMAVLVRVGVIGVARAEAIDEPVVVTRARVGVLDQQADRRAGGAPRVHAREDAHCVSLASLADEVGSSGTTAINVALQVGLRELEAGRTAIDNATKRRPVAFAEGRNREQATNRVARHPD